MPRLKTAVLILAAGKGSRMKSDKPKVMHTLAGAPMIQYVVGAATALEPDSIHAIIAPGMENSVGAAIAPHPFVLQHEQKGTGHAVLCARDALKNFKGLVFIMLGDVPLIQTETLLAMRDAVESSEGGRSGAAVHLLGMRPEDPTGYGRIVTDATGRVQKIVEQADCSPDEAAIDLVWSGIMAVKAEHLFNLLDRVDANNAQKEIYLTSIVTLANDAGFHVTVSECDTLQVQGVNSKDDLAMVEYAVQDGLRAFHLRNGVQMIDPETVYFAIDTQIGRDVLIEPHVFIGGGVTIDDGVTIHAFSHIDGAHIKAGAEIGPFARLRAETEIGEGAVVGNFVEVKKTKMKAGAKAKHLSYIGDATIGEKANIGAGVIFCNYDGYFKHHTDIGAGAMVGPNSTLMAPVRVGEKAIIGSGSVVTNTVKDGDLALARSRQIDLTGWATRYHADQQKKKKEKK